MARIAGGRLDLERLFKRLARGAEISLHQPCLAEETPPLDHARATVKESEEDFGGGGRVPLRQERLDEAVDDDQRLGIGLKRHPVVGFGPIEVAALQRRVSEMPVGIGEIGSDRESMVPKLFGPGFVAEVAMDRPEERPTGRIGRKIGQERLGDLEALVAEPRLALGDVGHARRRKHRPGGNIGRERLRIRHGAGLRPAPPGPLVGSLESLPRRQFFVGVAASADDEDDENDEEASKPHAGPRSPKPPRPRRPESLSLVAGRHVARLPADGLLDQSIGRHRGGGRIEAGGPKALTPLCRAKRRFSSGLRRSCASFVVWPASKVSSHEGA